METSEFLQTVIGQSKIMYFTFALLICLPLISRIFRSLPASSTNELIKKHGLPFTVGSFLAILMIVDQLDRPLSWDIIAGGAFYSVFFIILASLIVMAFFRLVEIFLIFKKQPAEIISLIFLISFFNFFQEDNYVIFFSSLMLGLLSYLVYLLLGLAFKKIGAVLSNWAKNLYRGVEMF